MTVDRTGPYKRVNESHWPGRVREAGMSRERSDDQRHLAEFAEFVKKEHRRKEDAEEESPDERKHPPDAEKRPPEAPHDVLDLHGPPAPDRDDAPDTDPDGAPEADPPKKDTPPDEGMGHLDITI
jgi:hypothetical protein